MREESTSENAQNAKENTQKAKEHAMHTPQASDRKNAETIFESSDGYDTRKVLNRAPGKVGLTREELENGVSIEQIEALPVPVFKYKTQITIHGIFPPSPPRVRGYKSLITNGNGSLGVRYIAIDAGKKARISRAVRLVKTPWQVNSDSTGYRLEAIRKTSNEALAELRELLATVPAIWFTGDKTVRRCRSMFGDWLIASIDLKAIREEYVAPFIASITGGQIPDGETFDRMMAEDKAKRDAEDKAWRAEYEANKAIEAEKKARGQAAIDEEARAAGLVLVEKPEIGKRYIMAALFGWEGKPGFAVVEYGKTFGRVIRRARIFRTAQDAIENINCELGKGKAKAIKPAYRIGE